MANDIAPLSEATNWKTAALGLVLAAAGLLVTEWATSLPEGWSKTVVLALSTAVVSTGVLALAFELLLRRNVYREMHSLSGLNAELASQRLVSSGSSDSISWKKVFSGKYKFRLLIRNPLPWIENNLNSLLAQAQSKPIEIVFYVPDPQGDYIEKLAEDLNIDHPVLSGSINQAIQRVERTWNDLADREAIHAGSKLEIRYLPAHPLHNLFVVDGVAVIEISAPLGYSHANPNYFYMHSGKHGDFPISSYAAQLDELDARIALVKE